jgi:hypothetical protein
VAQTKHTPIDLERLVMNIIMIALREHVDKYHKNRVSKSQYREINVCGAFDAWSSGFEKLSPGVKSYKKNIEKSR